jgi:hypothetical protein
MFWSVVVNLILFGGTAETYAEFDFRYEISGTLEPFVCAWDAPAKAHRQIGGKDRIVSALGIEEATTVGLSIAQEGSDGVDKFVRRGGYKQYTDGSPESLNFVVSVLVVARKIMTISEAYTRPRQHAARDEIDNALSDDRWLVEKAKSPTHDPHEDVKLHMLTFDYDGYLKGIGGLVGCALYPRYLTEHVHVPVRAMSYESTCPLNAAAQFMLSAPRLLRQGLRDHLDMDYKHAAARRAMVIAATNLLYWPLRQTQEPVDQRVAVSQHGIAFAKDHRRCLQQDTAELIAMYMSTWGPAARQLVDISRECIKTLNTGTDHEHSEVVTIQELQMNVPVARNGEFNIIEAMNAQLIEEVDDRAEMATLLVGEANPSEYIVVNIDRFSTDQTPVTKNHAPASFPWVMYRSKYRWKEGEPPKWNPSYDLRAMILRDDERESGHFSTIRLRDGWWWRLSEEHIEKIRSERPDREVAQFGCIFLYQRR